MSPHPISLIDGLLSADEFERLMAALGPFEAEPVLAVAVSGGGDSMALCLLADRWARARGGRAVALTVDHGLRPRSAEEAALAGRWLAARAIAHHVLPWRGGKPASGVQAAARNARYELLTAWARDAGVLHLLVAHHLDDQAETFLLRLQKSSGFVGLSAMSALRELPAVRLLRPLLGVSGERIKATLAAFGQDWIEDPSNRDPNFARTRVRAAMPALAGKGITPARLAATARRMGWLRTALEGAVSDLLAGCCAVYPGGYAILAQAPLSAAPQEVGLRALARILTCVGCGAYPPRRDKLKRLARLIDNGGLEKAATLGGCRILPRPALRLSSPTLLVCKEGRESQRPLAATAGSRIHWDGRFAVDFAARGGGGSGPARLARLGRPGWREIAAERPEVKSGPVPAAAAATLPALFDELGVFSVPHLNYRRGGGQTPGVDFARIAFCPPHSLSGAGLFLA